MAQEPPDLTQTRSNPGSVSDPGLPANKSLARTARTAREGAQPSQSITQDGDGTPASARALRKARRGRRAPNVYVSCFGPTKTRKRIWFTGRCRVCGTPVFGALKALDLVAGPRRLTCGHVGFLVAARVYLSATDQGGTT